MVILLGYVLAELSNDHKALTKQIDDLLQTLHAAVKPSVSRQPASRADAPVAVPHLAQQPADRPFALVDEVSAESPASSAGIQVTGMLHVHINKKLCVIPLIVEQ
jgi:hypothetical protein